MSESKKTKLNWKRWLINGLSFSGLFFLIGFVYQYHLPRIKSWLLIEVEQFSQNHLPVRVWPQNVEIDFFPPGITLEKIRIIPKKEIKSALSPTLIGQLEAEVSLIALLRGEVRLSYLTIKDSDIRISLPKKKSEDESEDKSKFGIRTFNQIPIDRFVLDNVDIDLLSNNKEQPDIEIKSVSLKLENKFRALLIDIETPRLGIKETEKNPYIQAAIKSRLLLDDKEVRVSAFSITRGKNRLLASGIIQGNVFNQEFTATKISSRLQFKFNELSPLVRKFEKFKDFPRLTGQGELDLVINYDFIKKESSIGYQLEAQRVWIESYEIGDIQSKGRYAFDKIESETLAVTNQSGSAELKDISVVFGKGKEINFVSNLNVKTVELRQFLLGIDAGDTPLHLDLKADLPCYGRIYPKTKIKCKGYVWGSNFTVNDGSEKDPIMIIGFDKMQATGSVEITDKAVSYDAKLKLGDKSTGWSGGKIEYDKGFDIKYRGDRVFFDDVTDIANLKFEGEAQIEGNTKGDSSYATIDMSIKNKGLWLEDFGLGKVQSNVRYKNGILTVRKIRGAFNSTRYQGNVSVNLRKQQIFISGRSPFADLSDIKGIFSRIVDLPLELTGTGQVKVKASGPLQFNLLSYNFDSQFYRGSVNNETFDSLVFNVNSKNGNVVAEKVELRKSRSAISLNGKVQPSGNMDTVLVGQGLRLEQSEILSQLGLNVVGQLDFTMTLRGYILKPQTTLNGRLSQVVVGNQTADDSNFKLKFSSQTIQGRGSFMGDLINTDFILPLNDQAPFRFYLKTKDWDPTQLFSMFAGIALQKDYQTSVTSEMVLKADQGGFWNSTGNVSIDEFKVRRGPINMSSKKPMKLEFEQGQITAKDFAIAGNETFLKLTSDKSTKDRLNFSINGKVDLTLASIFTPFLDDIRGLLSISTNISGPINDPKILGSAFVEDSYVKIKGYPHPFERSSADILFNHKNILINAARGQFASGTFTADGKVTIEGFSKVPINIRGAYKNVSLNFPQNYKSQGSGTFFLRGQWFPYTLGGTYNVSYGDITAEFEGEGSGKSKVKPVSFLPSFLTEKSQQTFNLNWDLNIPNLIYVKNSLADSGMRGRLLVRGTLEDPTLKGTLFLQKEGLIYFRENAFEISDGRVDFTGENMDNPVIFIRAQSRIKETYDVNLLIQGEASEPKINLNSQPPLSESDLISLLALGITPDDSGSSTTEIDQQASAASYQIGAALLQKPLGKQFEQLTGVEIQFSSLQNDEEETVPNVSFKKQWTPKFGVSASRTIETNPTNRAKAEYKFNPKVSVIGFWEGKEGTQESFDGEEKSKFGLDLEYKIEFK